MHAAANNLLYDQIFRIADDRVFARLGNGDIIRYSDLHERAARISGVLQRLGVVAGDRVAVQAEKSPSVIYLYLACIRIGAIFLPLNTAYTPTEIAYFLQDAEPRLFVCRPQDVNVLQSLPESAGIRFVTLSEAEEGTLADLVAEIPDKPPIVPRGEDDTAVILYTSGTTGRAKGAMLTHGNLASNAAVLADLWRFTREDVLIHALPVFHAHGLFVGINVTLFAGSSMVFLPQFNSDQVIDAMSSSTVMMGVPTYYTRLLQSPRLTQAAAASMRLFISGSAPLLTDTHKAWLERTGHVILERYGMTETGMNTSNPYDGDRIAGTVGHPLPGTSLRITDPTSGAPVAMGQIGMIEVKGPNVFRSYWHKPEQTRSEFRDNGYFITGDLGTVDERGYVRIVGRNKDLIISGGYNIYPKEIETELDQIGGVLESAVFGVPHPDFGEGVTAAIVLGTGVILTEANILSAIQGKLAKFKHPKRVVFLDEMPRNTMGKVQKTTLRSQYANLYQ